MKFTSKQLSNWRKYEKVRESGKFNMWYMWNESAMRATGLNRDEYVFTLRNYHELKEQAEA